MFPMAINETCPTLLREQKETVQSWELESFLVGHLPSARSPETNGKIVIRRNFAGIWTGNSFRNSLAFREQARARWGERTCGSSVPIQPTLTWNRVYKPLLRT